ncbi:flagellar brake protein [Paenibacillus arenosi]|uniref:PilZ domain-containing protein n=1 Tax=Paenibacillus arenosi TaxID=2774142 RepID=A0ABR9AU66_9BACL|nr:PilZ domain-containing protein [Paenibacillus arenosi]MBD8497650.1 PilZ domain-containing protein [Paenibacillus arenosi]
MFPTINDTLIIQTDSANHPGDYKARVLDLDDSHIWIEIPLNHDTGKYGIFVNTEVLQIRYSKHEGAVFQFMSNIVARKEAGVRMFGIRMPAVEDIRSSHQRSFLRVNAELEIAIRTSSGQKLLAITEDISGGGISFIVPKQNETLQLEEQIHCWMVVPFRSGEYEHIPFVAEVIRIVQKDESAANRLIMIKFHQISATDQQKVIRYCFERQLVQRRV